MFSASPEPISPRPGSSSARTPKSGQLPVPPSAESHPEVGEEQAWPSATSSLHSHTANQVPLSPSFLKNFNYYNYNSMPSFPLSVTRIIIHVGWNDVAQAPSELVKNVFRKLFDFVKQCGTSLFMSGPIPTFDCGDMRFSKIYGLHTWLRSVCKSHDVGFIDNFDLFWEWASFYQGDTSFKYDRLTTIADNIKLAVKRKLPAQD